MKVAIVTGNIIDGFDFYGPFDENVDAHDWAHNEFPHQDWWIIVLDDLPFNPERSANDEN